MKTTKQADSRLSKLSLEELKTEQKKRTGILIFFSVIFGIMILTSLYTAIAKKVSPTTFLPISFLPIYLIFWKGQQNLYNEIKSRKSN